MKKIILLLPAILILSACQEPPPNPLTRHYLMHHPDELAAQYKQCKDLKTDKCQLVTKTFYDFSDLYQNSLQHPQEFGQKVLDAQLAMTIAKENLDKAKANHASAEVIAQAEQQYQEKKNAVDDYLAVLGMTPPN